MSSEVTNRIKIFIFFYILLIKYFKHANLLKIVNSLLKGTFITTEIY